MNVITNLKIYKMKKVIHIEPKELTQIKKETSNWSKVLKNHDCKNVVKVIQCEKKGVFIVEQKKR